MWALCVRSDWLTPSPPPSDSSLGVTVIMPVSQQLQVCPHTYCILLRGRIRQLLSKPTNPYSDANALTMISAQRWDGAAAANEAFEQTEEVNKGRASPGEDAFSGGTQQPNPGNPPFLESRFNNK